jgi:NADH-quinone oxidoreductase subunit G
MEKADEEGIKHRLNLHATFCLEGCETGPSVRIDNQVVSGVTPDKADQVFTEIVKRIPENHRD